MSDNTSNTNNTLRNVRVGGQVVIAAFEVFVLAEILWYYLHDGEQTIHAAFGEYLDGVRERIAYRRQVRRAIAMVRGLPET